MSFSGSASAKLIVQRVSDGYLIKAPLYQGHLNSNGALDQFNVHGHALSGNLSLGKMGAVGPVTSEQANQIVTFASGTDYWMQYVFRDNGFTVRTKSSQAAENRDGIDGKWYYCPLQFQFTSAAQLITSLNPAGEFVLPVLTNQHTDAYFITFQDGTQLQVNTILPPGTPQDEAGIFQAPAPLTWKRNYLEAGKVYMFNVHITPGKPKQVMLTAPPFTLTCSTPGCWAWSGSALTITAQIPAGKYSKLVGQVSNLQFVWTVTDPSGKQVRQVSKPLAVPTTNTPITFSFSVPTQQTGFFNIHVILSDSGGILTPNQTDMSYSTLTPGGLPDLPASPVMLADGDSPDYAAWLGLGLIRVNENAASSFPAVADSCARTGVQAFVQFNLTSPKAMTPSAYATHVGQVVSANKAYIHNWEIINEPNINGFTPTIYLQYLKAAYQAIKAADPGAKVMGPTFVSLDSIGYLDQLYQLGAGPYFDIVSAHPYTGYWRGWIEENVTTEIARMRAIMAKYGDSQKPIWFTESGFQNLFMTTPEQDVQGRYIVQAFLLANASGISNKQMYYFFLRDHGFQYWYIMNANGSLLKGAVGMRTYGQQTAGLTFSGMLDVGRTRIGELFVGSAKKVAALMSYDYPTQAALETNATSVTFTDFYGNSKTLAVQSGRVSVPVNGEPVYVSVPAADTLSGVTDDWGKNLALHMPVTASSGLTTASHVTDGINTANGNHNGFPGWIADNNTTLPQWVEVDFPQATTLSHILIYANSSIDGDSGVRDYTLQVHANGSWTTVGSASGNWQHWTFEHRFTPLPVDKIRLIVTAMNNGALGTDPNIHWPMNAKIAEIEAYAN